MERAKNALFFFVGVAFGSMTAVAIAQVAATVNTNGVLKGYVVQKNGEDICRDPSVWLQFNGPDSYIVCE